MRGGQSIPQFKTQQIYEEALHTPLRATLFSSNCLVCPCLCCLSNLSSVMGILIGSMGAWEPIPVAPVEHVQLFKVKCSRQKNWHTERVAQ